MLFPVTTNEERKQRNPLVIHTVHPLLNDMLFMCSISEILDEFLMMLGIFSQLLYLKKTKNNPSTANILKLHVEPFYFNES